MKIKINKYSCGFITNIQGTISNFHFLLHHQQQGNSLFIKHKFDFDYWIVIASDLQNKTQSFITMKSNNGTKKKLSSWPFRIPDSKNCTLRSEETTDQAINWKSRFDFNWNLDLVKGQTRSHWFCEGKWEKA